MNFPASRVLQTLFLLACLAFEPTAAGQVKLSFSEALRLANRNNPQIAAANARVESARGLSMQAGLKPNPRGIVQLENYRAWEQPPFSFANSPDNYGILTQLVERGGKRQRRVDSADATTQRFLLESDLLGRQIASRVAGAYWAASAAEQVRLLWQRQLQSYSDLVSYTENRLREGVVAEADVIRAKVERNKALLSSANAAQQAVQARVNLYREMGQADFPSSVELDDPATAPATVLIPTLQLVLQTRYELQVARQNVIEAEAKLALQRANSKVDPDISLGYKRTVGVDTVYAAISVPLPIHNRNQGNIAAATADVAAAKANLRASENVVRAEVSAAQEEYRMRSELLSGTLPQMRQEAEEGVRIARAAYRLGGLDLLRLLDAERSRLDTELLYYQTMSQFQQSVVNLRSAIGATPGDTGPNSSPPLSPNGAKP